MEQTLDMVGKYYLVTKMRDFFREQYVIQKEFEKRILSAYKQLDEQDKEFFKETQKFKD